MKKIFILISLLVIFVISCGKEFFVDVKNNGQIPEFELKDFNGKAYNSKSIFNNGKPTLFIVAAEWCPHCRIESPYIEEFYEKYKENVNVVVVYSNSNTNLENTKKYIEENGYTYPTYYDEDGYILRGFGVQGFPYNLKIENNKVVKELELPVDFVKFENEFIR